MHKCDCCHGMFSDGEGGFFKAGTTFTFCASCLPKAARKWGMSIERLRRSLAEPKRTPVLSQTSLLRSR